ncbi:MAG: response regulator transcription factor [Cyanophyceae cyanobacterium]
MSTVLVVDDSSTDMEIFSQCLRQAGLSVISAKSGEEAQGQLASNSPDLIILDVILPGQSGFELCRELKNADGTRRIPVVMCSTKGTDVDKMWGDMLGADAYLTKPVNPDELINTVRKLLTKS